MEIQPFLRIPKCRRGANVAKGFEAVNAFFRAGDFKVVIYVGETVETSLHLHLAPTAILPPSRSFDFPPPKLFLSLS